MAPPGRIDVETVSRNQMEPVFAIDENGDVAFANERFLDITRLSRAAVIGAPYEVIERFVEDGFPTFEAAVRDVMRGETDETRVELSMRHPEEAPVPQLLPAETRITPVTVDGERVGVLVSLRNISTRRDHERQLERQNERLVEFASVVTHDLRNPLNVAEGRLQLARGECESQHLDHFERALARMSSIIESTLALAKQGQRVVEFESVDLSDFAERCWQNVETFDATLTVASEVGMRADPERLRNLFENLFRNAIEHGGERVTVRVGPLDDGGFFVEDDGPGIPPDERERVTALGYSTTEDGTGYGLAIVRWIVDAHDWELTILEGDDGGARFEFADVETT